MSQPDDRADRGRGFSLGPWRTLREGVYVAVAEPESVNLGLVVGAVGCVLVDTGSSPDQGRAVRAAIAEVTDRPLVAVALTHWHYDHAYGLAAFADLPTVGHESVAGRLQSAEAAADAERLAVDPAELAVPSRPIVLAAAYDLGDRRVEIAHLGPGHTDGDLVVVVPDADLIFAGDLIESAGPPSFGPDSDADQWATTLDSVIGLMTERTRAVPGHGEPVDREFVFEQRGRIAARNAPGNAAGRPELPLL